MIIHKYKDYGKIKKRLTRNTLREEELEDNMFLLKLALLYIILEKDIIIEEIEESAEKIEKEFMKKLKEETAKYKKIYKKRIIKNN